MQSNKLLQFTAYEFQTIEATVWRMTLKFEVIRLKLSSWKCFLWRFPESWDSKIKRLKPKVSNQKVRLRSQSIDSVMIANWLCCSSDEPIKRWIPNLARWISSDEIFSLNISERTFPLHGLPFIARPHLAMTRMLLERPITTHDRNERDLFWVRALPKTLLRRHFYWRNLYRRHFYREGIFTEGIFIEGIFSKDSLPNASLSKASYRSNFYWRHLWMLPRRRRSLDAIECSWMKPL